MSSRAIRSGLLIILVISYAWSITAKASPDVTVDDDHDDHDHDHDHDHEHEHVHGAMNDTHPIKTVSNGTRPAGRVRPKWEPYVYGTISVTIVSLLSLAGVVVIPFIKRKMTYDGVMLTFMALAVGTMTSDALLHLIPETLGLDEHGDEGAEADEHEHEHEEHGHEHIGKMTAVLGTLYVLYMLELILQTAAKLWKKPKVAQKTESADGPTVIKVVSEKEEVKNNLSDVGHHGAHHGHGHSHGHGLIDDDSQSTILGLKSVAFVIVLSDAMHNFTDGLAIGAAFSKSSAAGLGVSIAVICHEIPHEIGNFAILLNTGMGLKKALLLNFLSAVTCFAGLYPGIVAGQQEVLCRWIFAAVAAGFLYVALVHMLRELQHFGSLPWYLSLILQNLGMLFGFVIIFLLALYEEDLNGLTAA